MLTAVVEEDGGDGDVVDVALVVVALTVEEEDGSDVVLTAVEEEDGSDVVLTAVEEDGGGGVVALVVVIEEEEEEEGEAGEGAVSIARSPACLVIGDEEALVEVLPLLWADCAKAVI